MARHPKPQLPMPSETRSTELASVDPAATNPAEITPRGNPLVPQPYRVLERQVETADTVTLALAPVSGPAPAFEAGQFHMLSAYGVGEVPISISGEGVGTRWPHVAEGGAAPRTILHTVRAVGAVSAALVGSGPGSILGVRGPYGTGWDLAAAEGEDVLVVAGGIGLAPLRPAIRTLVAQRELFSAVSVITGARRPEEVLYGEEQDAWGRNTGVLVEQTVDHATTRWRGHVGVVTRLLNRAQIDPPHTHALLCGPEVMLRVVAPALVALGVSPEKIRVSMERKMLCGVGTCGHCQLGGLFICRDGPVLYWDRVAPLAAVREL